MEDAKYAPVDKHDVRNQKKLSQKTEDKMKKQLNLESKVKDSEMDNPFQRIFDIYLQLKY